MTTNVTLHAFCPDCKATTAATVSAEAQAQCHLCRAELVRFPPDSFLSDRATTQCVVCACTHLYRQKNFNRALGLGLVLVGAVLAFFTYGISLLVVALIDWIIYRRVKDVACCYLCGTIYRGLKNTAQIEPFNLVLHDHYRAIANKDY